MSKLLYLIFFSPFLMLFAHGVSEQPQDRADEPALIRDAGPQNNSQSSTTTVTIPNGGQVNRAFGITRSNRGNRWTGNQRSPLAQAKQKLKAAENEEQTDEAVEAIREVLAEQYDEFLTSNQKQIDQLQKRVDQLKEQLMRRQDAKNRMVDLEVQRMVNEAEGLVWPSNRSNRFFSLGSSPFDSIGDPFAEVPDVPGIYRVGPEATFPHPSVPKRTKSPGSPSEARGIRE